MNDPGWLAVVRPLCRRAPQVSGPHHIVKDGGCAVRGEPVWGCTALLASRSLLAVNAALAERGARGQAQGRAGSAGRGALDPAASNRFPRSSGYVPAASRWLSKSRATARRRPADSGLSRFTRQRPP